LQVELLYVHAPDAKTPFEDQLKALNELYKQGAFRQLGISNFTTEQVQEFYEIAKKNGYVLPTVYQGAYSAATRLSEDTLIPKLRELGISYYAYSPIAGGFLAKTRQQIVEGAGRFDPSSGIGQLYNKLFNKPVYLTLLDHWVKIAEDAGVSKAELAYRWLVYHSALSGAKADGIIFGARTPVQVSETVGYIRAGPLAPDVASRVDALWAEIKDEAPMDNFNQ
jgi:aflatoxin B1 aldehyde reductase